MGKIENPPTSKSNALLDVNFVDDDRIASYFVSLGTNSNFVKNISKPNAATGDTTAVSVIVGPLGTRLLFAIRASTELRSSDTLFDRLGSSKSSLSLDGFTYSDTFKYIDTIVRVTGVTTGYRLDVPVRFIKKS